MKLHDGGGRNQQEMETGMLTIQLSVTGDSGLYQCRAENAAGFTQATARLYIKPSGIYTCIVIYFNPQLSRLNLYHFSVSS